MRGVEYVAGAIAMVCACTTAPAFVCSDDSQCGEGGVCETTGFCSFLDPDCESGRRYEPKAGGGYESHCVLPMPGTTTVDSTTQDGSEISSEDEGVDTTGTDTGPDTTTDDPDGPSITVDSSLRFQTMDGMGIQVWDYAIASENNWNWRAAVPAFDDVDLHYAQLITLFFEWEPNNDNDDPLSASVDAFDPSGLIASEDIPMALFLSDRGYEVSIQKVLMPAWMREDGYEVPPGKYSEFAESVLTHQIYLETAGVPQEFVEISMVGGETDVFANPADAAEVARMMLASMESFSINRRLITPSVPGALADEWFDPWFADAALADATIAISVRGVATQDAADFESVAAWSEVTGKPVWAYDNWYCGADQGCPAAPAEDSTTWATAWEMAQQNWRLMVHANASRIYHAAMVGSQSSIVPETGEKNPTFFVLEHFANWIPPGSVRVQATSNVPDVWPVVVERTDGTMSLIVLNTGFVDTEIELRLPSSDIGIVTPPVQSIAGQYVSEASYEVVDGTISLPLPVNSLTSLHFAHD
ncbi:MAG: hypothetical protein JKY37_06330 [Nannocystaceae bacterium]|nr:hypothetical protein [Nannocystaceae bacterium]